MSVKQENLPDIATTQPDRLIKYRVSDDGLQAEVLLPGLWYTDFDKKIGGKMSYWSVLKFHESILMHGLAHMCINIMSHGANDTTFIASATYDISEKFHDIRYKSHFGTLFQTRAKLWVSTLGKTSFCLAIELFDASNNFLSRHVTKIVFVDRNTRQPLQLPNILSDTYQKSTKHLREFDVKRAYIPKVPSSSFQLSTKALHSDCDNNMHTNQVTYIRWSSDAAAEAAKLGYFRHIKRHIELYPLKYVENHFHGESLANDEVVVNVWEDEENPKCLWSTVSCKGQVIYHTKMEYYDGPPAPVEPHLESKL